jgi:hypothetical protein
MFLLEAGDSFCLQQNVLIYRSSMLLPPLGCTQKLLVQQEHRRRETCTTQASNTHPKCERVPPF